MKPELVADYRCECGENPLWHPTEKRLYWLDITTGRMFRYDPASGTHEQFYKGGVVGGFTFQADGAMLLFMARGAIKLRRGGRLTTVIEQIPAEHDSRFNDVIADPAGRVFCGTMPAGNRLGRLYRLSTTGGLTQLLETVACSNGFGFTPDRKGMYYTDSFKHVIYLFDYDVRSGEITNKRVFARVPPDGGFPDGMTVDAEGCVWSARWDGGCLVRYSPDGELLRRIAFPARKVSSVVFGGDDYGDIYVTTAGGDKKKTEGAGAGALFRLRLGIRGAAEFPSRVNV